MPDLKVRRRRVQVDLRPGQRTKLLGAGTGQERDDYVGGQGCFLSSGQQRLVEGERLRRTPVLPGWDLAQQDDVPLDLLASLSRWRPSGARSRPCPSG